MLIFSGSLKIYCSGLEYRRCIVRFIVSAVTVAVLAACGSSGNSGQLSLTSSVAPAKPTTPTTPVSTNTFNGTSLIAQDRNGANVPVSTLGSNSLDSVVIDGTTVALTQPGISAGTFTTISNNTQETIASGRYLSHMRFGAYRDFNANNTGANPSYAFALGSITPVADVPTTGVAKYTGLSVSSTIGGGTFTTGTSVFNVNFGNKTIEGTINDGGSFPVPLAGKINGAAFSGEKNGVNMSGHFFGPKAAELGGVYNGTLIHGSQVIDHIGSFGAKK